MNTPDLAAKRIPFDRLVEFVRAGGGSPMAFGVPADNGRHFVVDFGRMHDLYATDLHRDAVSKLTPGLVLRSIGFGEVFQTAGGFLCGFTLDPAEPAWSRSGELSIAAIDV